VDSVLAQTFSDYELIIADDGSSDATSDLITSYLQSGESKTDCIRYFRQPNQGKSVALNNAMLQAKGEWIAFLDSDDRWLPEKLERQFRAIEQFGDRRGACFTDGQFVNNQHMDTTAFEFFGQHYEESVGTLPDAVKTLATTPAGISIVTLVCRADLVRKVGGFDPDLRFTEDYDFLFRLALVTDFCFVNEPLVVIDRTPAEKRHNGSSAVWDEVDFRLQCEQRRYEKWLALTDQSSNQNSAEIRGIIMHHLRKVHSGWANWYLSNADYAMAAREIRRAANYQLTPGLIVKRILTRVCPGIARMMALRRGFDAQVF